MYLTYDEYSEMGGNLDDTAFEDLGFEAQTVVDWYTFGRLKNIKDDERPEELKRCMYRLITLLEDIRNANASVGDSGETLTAGATATIASQSNDGVSISYNVVSAQQKIEMADREKQRIVQQYLHMVTDSLGRRVLYRGLYPNE